MAPPPPRGPSPAARPLLSQGIAAQRAGRLHEAERLYEAAARVDRQCPDPHYLLGTAAEAAGRIDDAIRALKRAIKLAPERAALHATLGNLHLKSGHAGRARDAYLDAAQREPTNAIHQFNLGLALERTGDLDGAEAAYQQGAALAPQDPRCFVNLGQLRTARGRPEDAVEPLEHATRAAPSIPQTWSTLAAAWRELGNGANAVACAERALATAPDSPHLLLNLGQMLRELGRIDAAIEAFRRALALTPDLAEARLALAMTRRFTELDDDAIAIEAIAADPVKHGVASHDALFAHAKVLDDLGDTTRAFDVIVRANAARRTTFEYSIETDVAELQRIRAVFTAERVAALAGTGCPDATPIFVIGMPRSGTTLVEQIIASHRDVFGAGETMLLRDVLDGPPLVGGYPECLVAPAPGAVAAAGARYVELLRRRAPSTPHIVDKLPGNFLRLGAIRALLPNARVVHCMRDPRDTCVSILRQNFQVNLPYAFDPVELGRYYRLYEELMVHWRDVLGSDAFLDVRYEDLVDDVGSGAQRIAEYLGLDWDPAMLEFYRTERTVRTASLQQVRQPIFKSSVGQWRAFEQQLEPLLATLCAGRD